ncbi:MAG: bifunctional protein-serine/threonine kinase/phosphatase [Bacteriovorax sp.]|nr:bifunctional protein-serine/threonine kinase/phosphatase [Rhizobacter sp.]
MSFDVDIGYCSERGQRQSNEDFVAATTDPTRGLIAAVADGVSTGGRGLEAAQTTVMSLVSDYGAVPATWETTVVLDRLISAQNAWLADHNRRRQGDRAGTALTTLTALALQGHSWTVAHVGDTRAWLFRQGECQLLTQDHSVDHPDMSSGLTRALGLEDGVRVDYAQGELHAGDSFLLTSDGVHGSLKRDRLSELAQAGTAQEASDALVKAALEAGSHDNVSALVVRVRGLSSAQLHDMLRLAKQLPVPGRMKTGDVLDGYTVTALVVDNGVHRLLQARHAATRELVALKTLSVSRGNDPEERAMLAHEAWLSARVTERQGQGFVRVHEPQNASAFYFVYDWHTGQTLEQLQAQAQAQGRRPAVHEVVEAALAVAQALGRLHRQSVIHRDIKPGNLHRSDDGRWRVLDLGVALSGLEPVTLRSLHAGTPSYMNPEQWSEDAHTSQADAMSDLYALGVTLYQWLTGRLPYGEIEPYQVARFRRDPASASRLRPDVPIWLDHVLLKAVARERDQRFETAEELVLALERGASRPLGARSPTPLMARDPAALLKMTLGLSLAFNLLLIVWLFYLPR